VVARPHPRSANIALGEEDPEEIGRRRERRSAWSVRGSLERLDRDQQTGPIATAGTLGA